MTHYIAVVHHEHDSAFGIHFPDVPGCFSAADEIDDILTNAAEALALHLEEATLPEARSLATIRSDDAVARDLADGAFLVTVPFPSQ